MWMHMVWQNEEIVSDSVRDEAVIHSGRLQWWSTAKVKGACSGTRCTAARAWEVPGSWQPIVVFVFGQ